MGNLPMSTPMPGERAVSLVLEAEVMMDADTGRLTLVASTDHHMTDLDDVSPARLRSLVDQARTRLAEFERLANEYEARDTLRAILAEHDLSIEEWDTATLDPKLRQHLRAVYDPTIGDGRTIVVPAGQDPIARLAAVCRLLAELERKA
jgi:hypothetical protein